MEHQRFEQRTALGGVERLAQPARERPRHAAVEQVELRMRHFLHLDARSPGWKPRAEQRVGEKNRKVYPPLAARRRSICPLSRSPVPV